MKSPITPSPSITRWVMLSRGTQLVYSSAMLMTASERITLVSSPTMPIPIQKAAGIKLPCHEKHKHTDACHCYGFHDLRRAFATANATRMTADALQKLMRHRSYSTTKLYIAMAEQLKPAVENLHVPRLKSVANGN